MKKLFILFFSLITIIGFYQLTNFPQIIVAKLDTQFIKLNRIQQKIIYEQLDNYEFVEDENTEQNDEEVFIGMYYNVSYHLEDKFYEWTFFGNQIKLQIHQGDSVQEFSDHDLDGKLFNLIGDFIE